MTAGFRAPRNNRKKAKILTRRSTSDELDLEKGYSRVAGFKSSDKGKEKAGCSCAKLLDHYIYVVFITTVIVINGIFIVAEVHYEAVKGQTSPFFYVAEIVCTVIFTIELLMRLGADPGSFCSRRCTAWNILDFVLVSCSWTELIIRQISLSGAPVSSSWMFLGKLARLLKMAKVLRFLRALRFLGQLRTMVMMLAKSFLSLFWVCVLLIFLLTIFAVMLTQGATEYLKSEDHLALTHCEEVRNTFGDLFKTLYSLFAAMSGGRNWGEVVAEAWYIGEGYFALVCIFIFFTTFSVVNIVTGVFVDGAIQMAQMDRHMLIERKAREKTATSESLLQLLAEIDADGNGSITLEELRASCARKDVLAFMDASDINVMEAEALFLLLDNNGDGSLDITEFVDGMSLLKGEAKSLDVHMLMMHSKKRIPCRRAVI